MAAGAFISIFGTLNAIMLSGSRLPYALSVEKQLPGFLSAVHPRFKSPYWSLLFFTLAAIIISVSGSFITSLSIAVIIRILTYFFVCMSLIKLRKKDAGKTDYFRLRYGHVLAIAGMIICLWLLSHSKLKEFRDAGYALAVGLVIYFLHQLTRRRSADK